MFLLFKVFGLPAHALVVHAAVILVPLAAVGLAATGWRKDWRRHFSIPVTLMALGGALFAFIASQTGSRWNMPSARPRTPPATGLALANTRNRATPPRSGR